MTRPAASGFDRLRPRTPLPPTDSGEREPASPPPLGTRGTDGEGRRALFSVEEPSAPAFGSVSIECSACQQTSVLGFRAALRLAVPSLFLPVIRRHHPVWLHCPACGAWTWTRVRLRL